MLRDEWGNPLGDEAELADMEAWAAYWANLTPAERKSEARAMADYAAEADY